MNKNINYSEKMKVASLKVVSDVLSEVSKHGLHGNHHFYITFSTANPDTQISENLLQKYPTEMTIVIQHWYEKLLVKNEFFEITLNFSNQIEKMRIPFNSLKSFVDPSVEFGLSFDNSKNDTPHTLPQNDRLPETKFALKQEPAVKKKSKDTVKKGGDVVSLDTFRKT